MVDTTNPILKDCKNDNSKLKIWVKSLTDDLLKQRLILTACNFAKKFHKSDIDHLIKVTDILAQLGMNTDVLIAGILHDIVETQPTLLDEIEQRFGSKVSQLVDGVDKMKFIEELNDNKHKVIHNKVDTERLRNMLLAMAEDVRVILIKLADRLDNMRALRDHNVEKQRRIARETLDLFAPLANRLGMWQIKWELEDWSLRYLEPENYKEIAQFLDERRVDREKYIQQVLDKLLLALDNAGIKAELSGRPKHIYSIWRKMKKKGLDFQEVFDVRAVRVIVNTIPECYATLRIVHQQWQPLPTEFDDYISNPKPNNYQSLHTAVIGPDKKIFEVQIRTDEMHNHAEFGVASHWRYKEGDSEYNDNFEQRLAGLRHILQWNDEDGDVNDFLEQFKSDMFDENVYVLSPQGQVIDLPQGSKPLDFAYALHSKLGHRCNGVKVNNKKVPLNYSLKSGDVVNILTIKEESPKRYWLTQPDHLKTKEARDSIRNWFKKQDNKQHILDGRQLLDCLLQCLNIQNYKIDNLAEQLNIDSVNELLAAIGRGEIAMKRIADTFKQEINLTPYVDIEVIADDKIGLLGEISEMFSQENINILATNTKTNKTENRAYLKYELEVNNITELTGILLKIDNLDCVVKVWRNK
ncbi:RelA/SpoT family protein [Candidatus Marithrix sp. Canyon 246]|uniref:RelA/SpoT family protein n=1 Tax=Candidatus Marithrix sp. Canyon 246 TaxID=1827136 RepID=UPI00084A1510|nr:RelA/SpoT family protein [Candidatus Marithrix sp. Canyon 246]